MDVAGDETRAAWAIASRKYEDEYAEHLAEARTVELLPTETAALGDMATAGQDDAGLRSAIVNTFHELGGAFGIAALSSEAGAALIAASPQAGDFAGAFTLAAIVVAVSAAVAVVLVPSVVGSGGGHGHGH